MRVILKLTLAMATLCVAAFLLYVLSIEPYRQNPMKKRLESGLDALDAAAGTAPYSVAAKARQNITELRRALRFAPTDPDLLMELAAEYRFIGANDEALATYRRMLKYHRRPEIYLNVADLLYDQRDFAGARDSYAYAVAFAPEEINVVPNELYYPVYERAKSLASQLAR